MGGDKWMWFLRKTKAAAGSKPGFPETEGGSGKGPTGPPVGRVKRKHRRPATPAKISFTRPGRIRNCEMLSTQSRKSWADPRFQKFLRWLYKQQPSAFFRTRRNRSRTSQPYR